MKLLLVEDVEMLGWLGDIVNVKSGYARNYLVPQGLAVVPTKKSIESLAEEKASRASSRQLEYEQKEQMATSIEGAEVVLAAKTETVVGATSEGLLGFSSEFKVASSLGGFAGNPNRVVCSGFSDKIPHFSRSILFNKFT